MEMETDKPVIKQEYDDIELRECELKTKDIDDAPLMSEFEIKVEPNDVEIKSECSDDGFEIKTEECIEEKSSSNWDNLKEEIIEDDPDKSKTTIEEHFNRKFCNVVVDDVEIKSEHGETKTADCIEVKPEEITSELDIKPETVDGHSSKWTNSEEETIEDEPGKSNNINLQKIRLFFKNMKNNGFKEEESFNCTVCSKSFKHKDLLFYHSKIHKGEKRFNCEVCNKSFKRNDHLIEHSRIHGGEKRFNCEVCSKSFLRKSDLNSHSRIHTGERPFNCDVCNKSFVRKINLTAHSRTHTGEKPFQCEFCNKYFSQKSNLITHSKTHTGKKPFQCKACNKSFTSKSYLVQHLKGHIGEKSFQCKVCNKFFSQKSNLIQHSKIHTGEKLFHCEVCNKSFSRKGVLVQHLKSHTITDNI